MEGTKIGSFTVIMIDATVGNDYSMRLCSGLYDLGVKVELIVPVNRIVNIPVDFTINYWMPTKDSQSNRIQKIIDYLKYLIRVFTYIVSSNKTNQIVHFQFFRIERFETFLILLLRLFGTNLVFTAHNVLPHEHTKTDHIFRHIIYRSVNGIIVHSNFIKRKLAEKFKIQEDKIHVISHGNFDIFIPKETITKVNTRKALNLSEDDSVVLFFGYIREYKGLDLLLDAFEIIIKKNLGFKLLIAGAPQTSDLENHYKNRVAKISIDGSILYYSGFVPFDCVFKYFIASDVVVLPYKAIDHSGIVHLAYSFGRPVISTNVGDFPEVINSGQSGFVLNENTVNCLVETLKNALSNKQNLEKMGDYAKKLSVTKYSWKNIGSLTFNLYDDLLNNGDG